MNKLDIEIMQFVLDEVDEGAHVIDQDEIIVYCNKKGEQIIGVNRDKIIGKHLYDVFPYIEKSKRIIYKILKTKKPVLNRIASLSDATGKDITILTSSIPFIKNGKVEYILETYKDVSQVKKMSETILDLNQQLSKHNEKMQNKTPNKIDYIVTQNNKVLDLINLAKSIASSPSPVLIYGETGTGKELFVKVIYNSGKRRTKPFIAQNCAAFPETLLESILFGTVKGAFTGAEDKQGLFELANYGTIYLDELNSMPLELQSKLLRAIQFNEIRRVGGSKIINVDVRIIASINIDPYEAIQKKQLREDLYYRLNVIELKIPPLRDKLDDIPILVNHFVEKYNSLLGKNVATVNEEVFDLFSKYNWPGNVRQLENIIERIINFIPQNKKMVDISDINENIGFNYLIPSSEKIKVREDYLTISSLNEALAAYEKEIIIDALNKTGKNISRAAQELRIPRQTLQNKLRKYMIDVQNIV